jgi:hypothetical protein
MNWVLIVISMTGVWGQPSRKPGHPPIRLVLKSPQARDEGDLAVAQKKPRLIAQPGQVMPMAWMDWVNQR